jgi:uncharacterized MAPEG superfamily protein
VCATLWVVRLVRLVLFCRKQPRALQRRARRSPGVNARATARPRLECVALSGLLDRAAERAADCFSSTHGFLAHALARGVCAGGRVQAVGRRQLHMLSAALRAGAVQAKVRSMVLNQADRITVEETLPR